MEYNKLINVDNFKSIIQNDLIKYTKNNYDNNYGLVINILNYELNSFIQNIEDITYKNLIIEYDVICAHDISNIKINNDFDIPEPIKNAFFKIIG